MEDLLSEIPPQETAVHYETPAADSLADTPDQTPIANSVSVSNSELPLQPDAVLNYSSITDESQQESVNGSTAEHDVVAEEDSSSKLCIDDEAPQSEENIVVLAMDVPTEKNIESENQFETVAISQKPLVSYEDDEGSEEDETVETAEHHREEEKENRQILLTAGNKEPVNVSQILDDWETPQQNVNGFTAAVTQEPEKVEESETSRKIDEKKERINFKSYNISREEIMKELMEKAEKPILAEKDLFLSIELAKQRKQKESKAKEGNSSADREEIIGILEADQVNDWREAIGAEANATDLPNTPNDMQGVISEMAVLNAEIQHGQGSIAESSNNTVESKKETIATSRPRGRSLRKKPLSKKDRDQERILALKQLHDEFGGLRRRGKRSTAGSPTQVAAQDLQKALTSTSISGGKKRRPCYLPDEKPDTPAPNKIAEEEAFGTHVIPVKTYPVTKRKSEDHTVEVRTALDTLAAANKHLHKSRKEQEEEDIVKSKNNDKKVSEGKKTGGSTTTSSSFPTKKTSKEVDRLLGDEGAIRMLYDVSLNDTESYSRKVTKKDLIKKTQVVQSEVIKAGQQNSEKSLRRKRGGAVSDERLQSSIEPSEPLFEATTASPETSPIKANTASVAGGKRKQQKTAEASKILYRHSSSESFDSEGGLRLSTSELEDLDGTRVTSSSTPLRKSSRPRKISKKYATSLWMADLPLSNVKKQIKLDGPLSSTTPLSATNNDGELKKPTAVSPTDMKKAAKKETEAVSTKSEDKEDKEPQQRKKQLEVNEANGVFTLTMIPSTSKIENGMTIEVLEDFIEVLKQQAFNKSCKIVVLRNRGKTFCQGLDLSHLAEVTSKQRPKVVKNFIATLRAFVLELNRFPKPLVAAVEGAAVCLGTAIMPFCDVVLASADATFSAPYAKLGQGMEAAASYTFRKLSRPLVSQLVIKAETLTVKEAVRWGLVTEPVPLGSFESDLEEIKNRLITFSNQALITLKSQIISGRAEKIERSLNMECEILQRDWNSIDCITSFTDRVRAGVLIPNE